MFESFWFPPDFMPFWHIGARLELGPFLRFLKRMKKNGRPEMLDVGSGGGWNALVSAMKGFNVTCLDISENALKNTRAAADTMGLAESFRYAVADCASMPFNNDSFDVVVASHIIEHLENPKGMLNEIRRVLKDGGRLLLLCPSLNQWVKIFGIFGLNCDPPDHKVPGYSLEQIKNILPEGMEVVKTRYPNRFIASAVSDVQGILSRITGIKANPVEDPVKSPSRGALIYFLFAVKEIIILFLILLCRIEDALLFFIKGSAAVYEVINGKKQN